MRVGLDPIVRLDPAARVDGDTGWAEGGVGIHFVELVVERTKLGELVFRVRMPCRA